MNIYIQNKEKIFKKKFDLEIAFDEYSFDYNNIKHSIKGFMPVDIRESENTEIIKKVIPNIIKDYSYKIN